MTKDQLEEYFDRLFPIARSITGEGYRKNIKILKGVIPFKDIDVEIGSKVFDWTIPDERNLMDLLRSFFIGTTYPTD